MAEVDIINLLSDSGSSRPSSPFINISDVLNDSEKQVPTGISAGSDLSVDNINCAKDISYVSKSSPEKNRIVHTLSDSDTSETELPYLDNCDNNSDKWLSVQDNFSAERRNELSETETYISWYNTRPNTSKAALNDLPSTSNNLSHTIKRNTEPKSKKVKLSKEQKLEEKYRKEKEKELKRLEKLAAREIQNQMKPGNCIKHMTVILDSSLINYPFGDSLIAAIENSESKYRVSSQMVPLSVCWTRDLPPSDVKEEEDLILIWDWQFVIPAVKDHTLCSKIQEIKARCSGKIVSLVIYGLNGYFSYLKNKRRSNSEEPPKARKRKQKSVNEDFPYVTRNNIEEELTELQIMENCSHRLIESQDDLGQLIVHITKAIAERPYKLEKQRKEMESLEWFATGDSRDCVAVDKHGNGLLRLWQQQLCQFNMVGHDVAQAIAAVYPSPLSLVEAYENCESEKEAEELLKNIPVRRCQGPLASSRRVGPELSKKIHTFFTSDDGDAPLSQDQ